MSLPFRRIAPDADMTYALYGKLPGRADFVRVNANHSLVSEFDDLLQCALSRMTSEPDWTQRYDRSGPVAFQYVARDMRHTLIGVLAASRDESGRRYPMFGGAILPSTNKPLSGYTPIVPIAYEVFFDGLREQLVDAIGRSGEALDCRQYLESQVQNKEFGAADLDLAKQMVDRYMHATSPSKLHDLCMADCGAALEQALLNLAFYRAFLRRFDNPATNQLIVLPLPQSQGEYALTASAWLSILDALWHGNKSKDPWRGNFVLMPSSPEKMVLACYFGKAQETFVTMMLGGMLDPATLLNLNKEQEAWRNHRLYAEVSYALGRLLANPALTLSGLCEFLQDVGRKLDCHF